MDPNTDLSLRGWETSRDAAIASTLNSSTAMQVRLNSALKLSYDSQFDAFKLMVNGGKIANTNPPAVPFGYDLVQDEFGFSWVQIGKTPVCPARTDIPPDRTKTREQLDAAAGPGVIKIGIHLWGAFWQAMEGDTCPDGYKTPPMPESPYWPGGSIFLKEINPWGGHWKLIS